MRVVLRTTGGVAVTDRHDDDNQTGERTAATPPSGPGEGVRIIGAQEAQAALDSGAAKRRLSESEARYGDVPDRPDPTLRPGATFPRFDSSDAAAPDETAGPEDEPTAEHAIVAPDLGFASGPATSIDDETMAHDALAVDGDGRSGHGSVADAVADVGSDVDSEAAPAPEGLPHWSEPATGEIPIIGGDGDATLDTGETATSPRFRTGATSEWADEDLESFDALAPEPEDEMALSALAVAPVDDDVAFDREVAARRVRSTPSPRPRPGAPVRRSGSGHDELDLGPAPDRPDMLVRIVTGVGMAVLALVSFKLGRASSMVLATGVVGLCAFELFQALHQRGFRPATAIAMLGSIAIVPLAYYRDEFAFPFTMAIVMVFTLLWFVFEVVHTRPMVNVAVTVGGFVYVGGLGGFAGLLLAHQNGVGLLLGVVLPVIAYDIFGYFVGSQFGKARLAPTISPNKTIEGLIGGMAGAIIVSLLVVKNIHPWGSLSHAFALGITIACMAPLGDLAESMLKRDLGIKDFGAILPGHGGALDRFDAVLFCMPAVYFLARGLGVG